MNSNEDKIDCAEFITRALERTAVWRRTIAPRFDDHRHLNIKAAETLEKLVVDASGLTEGHWQALKPHYAWSSNIFRDALFNATRQIGFSHKPRGLDSFVRLVLRQLSPVRVAA